MADSVRRASVGAPGTVFQGQASHAPPSHGLERRRLQLHIVALLLDLPARICTMMLAQLPNRRESRESFAHRIAVCREPTGVAATFLSGAIDAPYVPGSRRHEPTRDLVGKHCITGAKRGLADTDRCHYFRIAPELYLFVWREKVVPGLGCVVLDYQQMKSSGRIVGYEDFECRTLTSVSVGARMRIIGDR